MFLELIGYVMEPPELGMDNQGEYGFQPPEPVYEPMLINTEAVTLIAPSDDEQYALIFLTDGMVIMTHDTYHYVTAKFKKDYIVLKPGDKN